MQRISERHNISAFLMDAFLTEAYQIIKIISVSLSLSSEIVLISVLSDIWKGKLVSNEVTVEEDSTTSTTEYN